MGNPVMKTLVEMLRDNVIVAEATLQGAAFRLGHPGRTDGLSATRQLDLKLAQRQLNLSALAYAQAVVSERVEAHALTWENIKSWYASLPWWKRWWVDHLAIEDVIDQLRAHAQKNVKLI